MLAGRGNLAGAESLARASLTLARQVRPDQWVHANALVGLGRIRLERGDPVGAERFLREGLVMTEKYAPPGNWRLGEAKRLLGAALAAQSRYPEAEPYLLAGAEFLRKTVGDKHPKAAQALRDVIALYEAWGRPERTREYRKRLKQAGGTP